MMKKREMKKRNEEREGNEKRRNEERGDYYSNRGKMVQYIICTSFSL